MGNNSTMPQEAIAAEYQGYTEMLLQERHLLYTTGNYSKMVYVISQNQYYAYSGNDFQKIYY